MSSDSSTQSSCIVCGSTRWKLLCPALIDYLTEETFTIERCEACRLLVTRPMPGEAEMGRYYPPRYRGNRHSFTGGIRVSQRRRAVEKCFASGFRGRLLDLGAGAGTFALAMKDAGWHVAATEIDPAANERLRAAGVDAMTPAEALSRGWSEPFDAITCWHVLEHVHRPDELAAWARKLLKPDGVFQVTVPNVASWQANLFRKHWLHLDVPRHLYHFTPATLTKLLSNAGFETKAMSTFAWEYDWFGWIQSPLNAMTTKANYLFENLMGSPSPAPRKDRVVSWALAAPLAGATVLPSLISWILGQGATLTATCRPV